MINQFEINIFRFAMGNNLEIPCSFCPKWDAKAISFSCNPYECQKLSEWLSKYAKIMPTETKKVALFPIHYIV
jgi:hypothetical protein